MTEKILTDEDLKYLAECELIYHPNPAMPFDKVHEFCVKYGWTAVFEKRKYQRQYKKWKKQLSSD